jgi:hypothetical protein
LEKIVFPALVDGLKERHVSGAGFLIHHAGSPRVDATCWGILALSAEGSENRLVEDARRALAAAQWPDGRVCITRRHRDAFWPTPLAMLAWHPSRECKQPQEKAARFLLDFDQLRLIDDPDAAAIIGHDPTIRGWPWIAGTSPWLEPTAYCLMALRLAGFEAHERTQEARRLIMNRQLSTGGWNVGNTTVYGNELRPVPETTGAALQALAGLVPRQEIARSIDYLRARLPHLTTPFALAWAILGLSAWGEAGDRREHLQRLLAPPQDSRTWSTVSLSLGVLAGHCENGLLDWLRQTETRVL